MWRFLILVLACGLTLRSAPLDQWVWRHPTPFGFNAHEILFADGKFTFIGAGGYAGVSTDGRNWQLQPHFDAGVLSELYYANGRWFASGYVQPGFPGNVTTTSTDGLHYSRLTDQRFTSVVFTRGIYLASSDTGINRSTDGVAWELVETNNLNLISMALTADQHLVGLSFHGALLHSSTGTDWTVQHQSSAKFLSSYNGVLYAFNDNLLLASADGRTWTTQRVTTPPWVLGGLFTDKSWIIYGQTHALKPQFSHSFDQGKTWTLTDSLLTWRTFGMAYGNGKFVATGAGVAVSEDGIEWENLSDEISELDGGLGALAYGNGVYIAGGSRRGEPHILWSTNAINWSLAAASATGAVYRLAFGPSGFVAGGSSGMLLHSPDGRAWSDVSVQKYRDDLHGIHDLKVYDGKYYAVGRSVLLVSSDGRNWQDYPLGGVFYSITKVGNRFIIGGPEAGLRTSENLVDWTYVPSAQLCLGVYSALGKAYARTWDSCVVSSDGLSWTPSDEPTFTPVAGFDRGILAIRTDGASPYPSYPFSYSSDGIHWRTLGSPGRLQINDTLYVNGRLFALASGGILEASQFGLLHLDQTPNSQLKISLQSSVAAPRFQISTDLQKWSDTTLTPGAAIDPSAPQTFFRARLDQE